MSDEKLEPCPFCGAPVRVHSNPLIKVTTYMCMNPTCGADVMFYAGDRLGRAVNDALWNKRVKVERVEE